MTATTFRRPTLAHHSPSALVVEPNVANLLFLLSTLSALGFDVTVAETFSDAKRALAAHQPQILVTDVRLHEYNGLHLVLRAKNAWPGLPMIVVAEREDAVLQQEAAGLGATFVVLQTTSEELAAAVHRTLFHVPGEGQAPITAPFERRQADRRSRPSPGIMLERRQRERRRDIMDTLRLAAAHT